MRNSKAGSDFPTPAPSGAFLVTGLYSKVGSWLLSLRRWAVFVSFLYSPSLLLEPIFFFGRLGLCFRKQVDLPVLWSAQTRAWPSDKQLGSFPSALGLTLWMMWRLLSHSWHVWRAWWPSSFFLCALGTNIFNMSCFQHPLGYITSCYQTPGLGSPGGGAWQQFLGGWFLVCLPKLTQLLPSCV